MKRLLYFLIILLTSISHVFLPNKLYSQRADIAIICDISRSIKDNELVQGKQAIKCLLNNGIISAGWELASSSSITTYPFLTQHGSLIVDGVNLAILKFGTIISNSFPYFSSPQSIQILNLAQVMDFIEENFPRQVQDPWTYEFLAEAVISKLMKEQFKSREWYLFVLSDFIESHGFSMTNEQTILVDNYLEGRSLNFSQPVIFRWIQRPDLQIKIVKISTGAINQNKERITLLTPQNNFKFKKIKAINFIWNWKGNADEVTNYILVVRERARDSYNLALQQRLKLNKYFLKKPKPGNYEWFVTANTVDGTFRSPIRKFQVAGPSALPWLLSLLILFLAAIAFFKFIFPKIRPIKKGKKEDGY